MKTTISFLAGIFFTLLSLAQDAPEINETFNFGGTGVDNPYDFIPTSDDGYLMVGSSASVTGDVGANYGGSDIWVVKLNSSASLVWEQNFGGSSNDVARSVLETTEGDFVLLGYSSSNNVDVSENNGASDLWIIKFSDSGELIWEHSYGGSGNDYGIDLAATADEGFLAVGNSFSADGDVSANNGDRDLWVLRLDPDGELIWEQNYGGSLADAGLGICETSEGEIMVIGNTASPDGDVEGHHGEADAWTLQLSDTGDIIWQRCSGGTGMDYGNSMIRLPNGNSLFVGQSSSSDGDVGANQGGYDFWAVQLSSSGELLWENSFGGTEDDFGAHIIDAIGDGYILSGNTLSSDGDVSLNQGDRDAWLIRIDEEGNLVWEKTLGGAATERGQLTYQNTDGSFLTLTHSNSMDGDFTGSMGGFDYWLVSLAADPLTVSGESEVAFSLFPNPVNGNSIVLSIPQNESGKYDRLTLRDIQGRPCMSQTIKGSFESRLLELNPRLPNGVYVLELVGDGISVSKKMVLQR